MNSSQAGPERTFGSEILNSYSVDHLECSLHVLHELRQICHLSFYHVEASMLGPSTAQLYRMIHIKAIGKIEQRQGTKCSGVPGFHEQVQNVQNSWTF